MRRSIVAPLVLLLTACPSSPTGPPAPLPAPPTAPPSPVSAPLPASTPPSPEICGLSPTDWCPSPPGDPCAAHRDEATCRADPACQGMPYRGESAVPCIPDGRGFAANCPAVGCVSRPR